MTSIMMMNDHDDVSEPSSDGDTAFDDSDLLGGGCPDDVTAQLVAAGKIKVLFCFVLFCFFPPLKM